MAKNKNQDGRMRVARRGSCSVCVSVKRWSDLGYLNSIFCRLHVMTTSNSATSGDDVIKLERKEKLLSRLRGEFLGIESRPLVEKMCDPKVGVEIKDRKWRFRTYKTCFVGSEAVDWLVTQTRWSRDNCVEFCRMLMEKLIITHVCEDQPFRDGYFFYIFRWMRNPKKIGQRRVRNENKLTRSVDEILSEHNFDDVVRRIQDLKHGFQVKDRRYLFKTFENCFNAKEAVEWLVKNLRLLNRAEAVVWGRELQKRGIIDHVTGDWHFKDQYLFFKFIAYYPQVSKEVSETIDIEKYLPESSTSSSNNADNNTTSKKNSGWGRLKNILDTESKRQETTRSYFESKFREWINDWNKSTKVLKFVRLKQIPESLGGSFYSQSQTKYLDCGYVITFYNNTGSVVISNIFNDKIVQINNHSPIQCWTHYFPLIVTIHEKTIQFYNILSNYVKAYTFETGKDVEFVVTFLDNKHFVLVTKIIVFFWRLDRLSEEPKVYKLNNDPPLSFEQGLSSLHYPYLILGRSDRFQVHHIKDRRLVLESKPLVANSTFFSITFYDNQLIACTNYGFDLYDIRQQSTEPKTIKTLQPISAVYMKNPDFFFMGDIFGGITVYEKNGTLKCTLTTGTPPSDAELTSLQSFRTLPVKINSLISKDNFLYCAHENALFTLWNYALDQSLLTQAPQQQSSPFLVEDFKTSGPCRDLVLNDNWLFFLCKNEKVKAVEVGIFNTLYALSQKKKGSLSQSPRGPPPKDSSVNEITKQQLYHSHSYDKKSHQNMPHNKSSTFLSSSSTSSLSTSSLSTSSSQKDKSADNDDVEN